MKRLCSIILMMAMGLGLFAEKKYKIGEYPKVSDWYTSTEHCTIYYKGERVEIPTDANTHVIQIDDNTEVYIALGDNLYNYIYIATIRLDDRTAKCYLTHAVTVQLPYYEPYEVDAAITTWNNIYYYMEKYNWDTHIFDDRIEYLLDQGHNEIIDSVCFGEDRYKSYLLHDDEALDVLLLKSLAIKMKEATKIPR